MLSRSQTQYKPVIFYRALALVLVPIVLGTILLVWLSSAWSSSELALGDENKQWRLVILLSKIFSEWGTSSARVVDRTVQEDPQSVASNVEVYRETDWYFTHLESLSSKDKKRLATVKRLEEIYRLEGETLKTFPNINAGGAPNIAAMRPLPKLMASIYKLRTEVGTLINTEWMRLHDVQAQGDTTRSALRNVLYLCCVVNFLLACILGFLFSLSITSRLRMLMANANCLPRNEAFPAQVNGNDELAYLNHVLGEAAGQLKAAAEHRQSIIGMVAHDMRSPLMAAQASLQLVEEMGLDCSDQAALIFEEAFNDLSGILSYVQDLLSEQRESLSLTESSIAGQSKQKTVVGLSNAIPQNYNSVLGFLLRPRVLHKGLMLVAIPLLFQTAILLTVNQEILKSESITRKGRQLSDSLMNFEFMRINMIRGSIAQGIYYLTSNQRFEKLALKIFKQMEVKYGEMAFAAKDNLEDAELVRKAKALFDVSKYKVLALQPGDPPEAIVGLFEKMTEVNTRSGEAFKLREEAKLRSIRERVQLQTMEDERKESAAIVSDIFGWSILANFGLSIALLLAFNSNIRSRLNVLTSNATKLGQRQALQQTVNGTDEFAFLDLSLHNAEAQINQSSAQRAQMMASLARDMRTPLQNARAKLSHFEKESASTLSERAKNYLLKANRNIDRVVSLIDNLLTIESLNTGSVHLERSNCDTKTIAEDALNTVAALAQNKQIILRNDANSFSISADNEKLVQVLVNLLGNAIKFSGEGSCVWISCDEKSGMFCFAVHDQGPGMNEETRKNVFEKFYQAQTEQKEQGFGLGLAICKLIVESHGGTISVESTPGVGTVFRFEIPKRV